MSVQLLDVELRSTFSGKRVLVTGHSGFKGSWLALWLQRLGADLTGYSLAANTEPALFDRVGLRSLINHVEGDVRDIDALRTLVEGCQPEIIFHLAAQSLVRRSYERPIETLQTNILGTANLLEAVRLARRPVTLIVITTDKVYENKEWIYGYRETEQLGGYDTYSSSKAAAEIVTASYRSSFFPLSTINQHGVAIATARAGNVVGGGDWAKDRLVPDAVRALAAQQPIVVRNPDSVRPWQHVLEPLSGYLLLAAKLASASSARQEYCEAWNFGPRATDTCSVRGVVEQIVAAWGGNAAWQTQADSRGPHEAGVLRLSIEKSEGRLGWAPRWTTKEAISRTIDWYRAFYAGGSQRQMMELCTEQIEAYQTPTDTA